MAKTIKKVFEEANVVMQSAVIRELHDQGHRNTGALETSIQGEVTEANGVTTLTGTALAYAVILNKGVVPARIPFGGVGKGVRAFKGTEGVKGARVVSRRTSQYIQGLIRFFKEKGLDDEEAKGAAFATARKHKKEGMPTAGSAKYSLTGQRLNFVGTVQRSVSKALDTAILGGIDQVIDDRFRKTSNERI